MRIHIAGGGPAGLYFAILMKRLDPSHEIRVFERNARHTTFGWGVVFSGQTLTTLAQADPESHHRLSCELHLWEELRVVHRDQSLAIQGNRFSGLSRLKLLEVLQERALELGIEVSFEHPLEQPEREECDLLVGADGVGSLVREAYAEHFQPQIELAANRYIWLGTPKLFEALTLTFREAEEGVVVAHSYRYCADRSTFIVECGEEACARIGDNLTRLEEIFAPDLEGQPLLSNQSRWIRFVRVKNRNWFHPRVVLLGDALHTAHFSIGSGTKLAMEDSIALAACFERYTQVAEALQAFEKERKGGVERYQAVAEVSQAWFEAAPQHVPLHPMELAYRCMTRSKVDEENLKLRDPDFVARYQAWRG